MINSIINDFVALEKTLSRERGPFTLFALVTRGKLHDLWDLIVAAPWAQSWDDTVRYLVEAIKREMGPSFHHGWIITSQMLEPSATGRPA